MPVLTFDKPFPTREPSLLVENQLRPGLYLLELVVVDNDGKQSAPAVLEVQVVTGGVIRFPPGGGVIQPPGRVVIPPIRPPGGP